MLEQENRQLQSGSFSSGNREFLVETSGFLHSADEVGDVVVGVSGDRPVYLREVARVEDGAEEPADYVLFGTGPAEKESTLAGPALLTANQNVLPAVTISVAKRKGTNAIVIADQVIEKVKHLQGTLIPGDVNVVVTRNYGETASEKSNELLST